MLNERQVELDRIKWFKSQQEGRDTCGEFDYCKNCDKSLLNPCATAYEKTNTPKVVQMPKVETSSKNKCEVKKPEKETVKKTTTKAVATKKGCCKKTTKK